MAEDTDRYQAVVKTVMNLQLHKMRGIFLTVWLLGF
jgi:hypothetical protein